MKPKHFLDIDHCDGATLEALITHARAMKARRAPRPPRPPERLLEGAVLAMLFEKPSTRTRFSFDVAMRELGGETLVVNRSDMQLGRGETIADTARVLSRYVDAIMLRTTDHDQLLELASHATVPVINGLSNFSHPCQIVADLMTFVEHRGALAGKTVAWVGDCNNVAASWVHAALRLGFHLRVATPEALPPPDRLRAFVDANRKAKRHQGSVHFSHDPQAAATGADCLVTDTWVSMGDGDIERRCASLRPYQVDAALMALAKPDAIFMHCLPASRGQEVAAEVIDGPQSVVFDEAENRLHAQKAILAYCLGGGD